MAKYPAVSLGDDCSAKARPSSSAVDPTTFLFSSGFISCVDSYCWEWQVHYPVQPTCWQEVWGTEEVSCCKYFASLNQDSFSPRLDLWLELHWNLLGQQNWLLPGVNFPWSDRRSSWLLKEFPVLQDSPFSSLAFWSSEMDSRSIWIRVFGIPLWGWFPQALNSIGAFHLVGKTFSFRQIPCGLVAETQRSEDHPSESQWSVVWARSIARRRSSSDN